MKKTKQMLSMALMASLTLTALAGCAKTEEKASTQAATTASTGKVEAEKETEKAAEKSAGLEGNLVMMTNASDLNFEALEEVVEAFMEENPGVTVDLSTQTKDYEALMKAKMAANDLPDVFCTHGWSVARYSEYLMPLNEFDFYPDVLDTIKPIVTNEAGEIFVLPINMDRGGMLYNKTILDELGMEIPNTLDEFMNVCEAAKQAGYTPIYICGKDDRQPANMLDITATSWLISPENNEIDALLDGSFDWSKWDDVAQYLFDLQDKGYFNVDATTADTVTISQKLAEGNILFMFQNNMVVPDAYSMNPEANIHMMPMPTVTADDEPHMYGGEREAYGIWKDSPNIELATALINFMARPENIRLLCEVSGLPSALAGIEVDLGELTEDYAKYEDLRTFPYFDRVYLPSGMWATLRTTGSALLAGESTAEEASKIMEESYLKLLSQAE